MFKHYLHTYAYRRTRNWINYVFHIVKLFWFMYYTVWTKWEVLCVFYSKGQNTANLRWFTLNSYVKWFRILWICKELCCNGSITSMPSYHKMKGAEQSEVYQGWYFVSWNDVRLPFTNYVPLQEEVGKVDSQKMSTFTK